MIRTAICALSIAVGAGAAQAGDASSALPFEKALNLGGPFALTDHTGTPRTQADPDGKYQLVFFGYANCLQICSAALPLMGQITETLQSRGTDVRPVMITVDPKRDTVDTLGAPLALHHPDFVGLTGTEAELQVAYDAFQVEKEEIFIDPEYGPVFAHGSFVYLLDSKGEFLTLFPPILAPEQASDIVETYTDEVG